MTIPKSIKIKTKKYDIVYDKELLRDDNCYGRVYHAKLKIFLDETQSKSQRELAFLHEVLHAVVHCSSLRNDLADRNLQEKVVTGIAEDLLLVLQENKLDFSK